MPFGLIFGALFFGGICIWAAAGLLGHPAGAAKLTGVFLALLGLSLAAGLLTRRPWARWGGIVCAAVASAVSLRRAGSFGEVADYLLLLAAVATAVLLALPATGAARAGGAGGGPRRDWMQWTALTGFVGLLAIGLSAGRAPAPLPEAAPLGAITAAATAQPVAWSDFATGLVQSRQEGKPVLATFVTSWCGYCSKMSRSTWKAPAVAARLGSTIPVRVDVEDPQAQGPELAQRYQIRSYPVQILLDPTGRVVARSDGYQTPTELLSWLDRALVRYGSSAPQSAAPSALR